MSRKAAQFGRRWSILLIGNLDLAWHTAEVG